MIDRIAALWGSGKSLLEIGKTLRLSRGIVAGHIHRASKAGDPRFPPKPKAKRPRSKLPLPSVSPPPAAELPRGRKLLIDLPANGCRYPTGVAADGRHLFCGLMQVSGRPYCKRHNEGTGRVSASPPSSSASPCAAGLRR